MHGKVVRYLWLTTEQNEGLRVHVVKEIQTDSVYLLITHGFMGVCHTFRAAYHEVVLVLIKGCSGCFISVIITPRACARGKVISCVVVVVVVVSTKIAISRYVGI